jgi:FkbM family methyltransferase
LNLPSCDVEGPESRGSAASQCQSPAENVQIEVVTRYGNLLCFADDTIISRSLRLYGEWAQDEIEFLTGLVIPGDVVVDVGAFIGTHTLALAQAVGPEGQVLAFEPNPETARLLRANVARLGLGNIRVSDVAVADGCFQFRNVAARGGAEGCNRGANMVALDRAGAPEDTGSPTSVSLDSLRLEACRLIKIDAEGLSAEVLRGARDLLGRLQPLVVAEVNSIAEGAACLEAMSGLGYESWALVFDTFSPDNYNRSTEMLFSGREVALLLAPAERPFDPSTQVTSSRQHLVRVSTLDDFAVALLAKPQYHADVLQALRLKHCVTPEFPVVTNAAEIALGADLGRRLPAGAGPFGALLDQLNSRLLAQVANVTAGLEELTSHLNTQADNQATWAASMEIQLETRLGALQNRLADQNEKQELSVSARLEEVVSKFSEHLQARDHRRETRAAARAVLVETQLVGLARRLEKLEASTSGQHERLLAATFELAGEVAQASSKAAAEQRGDLAMARRELDRLRHELSATKRSLSWRLTRPFRLLARERHSSGRGVGGESPPAPNRKSKPRAFQRTLAKLSLRHPLLGPLSRLLSKPERRLASDYRLMVAAGLFDPVWYRQQYAEAAKRGKDPLWYFLRHGGALGHAPNPDLLDAPQDVLLALRARHPKAAKALRRYLKPRPGTAADKLSRLPRPTAAARFPIEIMIGALAPIDPPDRAPAETPGTPETLALLASCPSLDLLVIDHDMGGGANKYRRQLVECAVASGSRVGLLTYRLANRTYAIDILYDGQKLEAVAGDITDVRSLGRYLKARKVVVNNLVSFKDPLFIAGLIDELTNEWQAELEIPIHDFYPICPSYTLLDWSGQFCRVPSLEACRDCVRKLDLFLPENQRVRDIDLWRTVWARLLGKAHRVVCFSTSSADLLRRAYPALDTTRIVVRPHDVEYMPAVQAPHIAFDGPLHIGVVGEISVQKGAVVVERLAAEISRDATDISLTVIGTIEARHGLGIAATGRYEVGDLQAVLERLRVNVCLVPSIWPETFCYVVEELIHLRMPVAAFDLGAPAERLRDYAKGCILTSQEPRAIIRELRRFHQNLAAGAASQPTAVEQVRPVAGQGPASGGIP